MRRISTTVLIVVIVLMLAGCKTITVTPEDFNERVPMIVRCTAGKPGSFTLVLKDGDGNLSPPSGQAITVTNPPLRVQYKFTPNLTGKSRTGQITCYHSADEPGRPVRKQFTVRDAVKPKVEFVAPNAAKVGETFAITVDIKDKPINGQFGVASGLDKIRVNTTGPLMGPGVIDLAGAAPGPPDGAKGPEQYNIPINITCTGEGRATIKLIVDDAAGNTELSKIHNMECYR